MIPEIKNFSINNNNYILRTIIALCIYFIIKYIIPNGNLILYPVNLLVTFLHEFGHGLGALLTGGSVERIQINADGSGFAETLGGWRAIVLMGGYIGSAIFGNLLFYIGLKKPNLASFTLYILAALLFVTGFFWFNSIFTTVLLVLFGGIFIFLAKKETLASNILVFLGLASVIHIVEDFNVGPSSDLAQYAQTIPILPASVWMYVWLAIVLIICFYNIKIIIKS